MSGSGRSPLGARYRSPLGAFYRSPLGAFGGPDDGATQNAFGHVLKFVSFEADLRTVNFNTADNLDVTATTSSKRCSEGFARCLYRFLSGAPLDSCQVWFISRESFGGTDESDTDASKSWDYVSGTNWQPLDPNGIAYQSSSVSIVGNSVEVEVSLEVSGFALVVGGVPLPRGLALRTMDSGHEGPVATVLFDTQPAASSTRIDQIEIDLRVTCEVVPDASGTIATEGLGAFLLRMVASGGMSSAYPGWSALPASVDLIDDDGFSGVSAGDTFAAHPGWLEIGDWEPFQGIAEFGPDLVRLRRATHEFDEETTVRGYYLSIDQVLWSVRELDEDTALPAGKLRTNYTVEVTA